MSIRALALAFIVVAAGQYCFADTIFLKDGNEVEGTIVEDTNEHVIVKLSNGTTRTYSRASIETVVKSKPVKETPQETKPTGTNQNSTEHTALNFIEKTRTAAENGDGTAQIAMASFYFKGTAGFKQDMAEAEKWLNRAAQVNAHFKYEVGMRYVLGEGITRDYKKGMALIQTGAQDGDPGCQRVLGMAYLGLDEDAASAGIQKDIPKAAQWIKKSAENGDSVGQYILASMYIRGDGFEKSSEEGLKWLRKSADQGFEAAIKDLKARSKQGQ